LDSVSAKRKSAAAKRELQDQNGAVQLERADEISEKARIEQNQRHFFSSLGK
jgi:hypothetical protein